MDTVEILIYFPDGTLHWATKSLSSAVEAIKSLIDQEEEFYVEYQ